MNADSRDLQIIARIHAYCREIAETCERFGREYDVFSHDKIYRNACVMCILQIGELAGRLSDTFRKVHATIPWKAIRAMRNVAAHAYGTMSIPTIWNTIENRIPELEAYCKNLLIQSASCDS